MKFHIDFAVAELFDGAEKRASEIYLLHGLGHAQSTDPKDFVFGTLALAERMGVEFPPLNYHMSLGQIYAIATRCWLRHHGRLSCLMFAATSHRNASEIPSWDIDWRNRPRREIDWEESIFESCESNQKNCQSWIKATQRTNIDEGIYDGSGAQEWGKLRLKGVLSNQSVLEHVNCLSVLNAQKEKGSLTETSNVGCGTNPTKAPSSTLQGVGYSRTTGAEIELIKSEMTNGEMLTLSEEVALRWLRLVHSAEHKFRLPHLSLYQGLIRLVHGLTNNGGRKVKDPLTLNLALEQVGHVARDHIPDENNKPLSWEDSHALRKALFTRKLWTYGTVGVLHFRSICLLWCIEDNDLTLFLTSNGQLGACYCADMKDGDTIALLSGSDFPMVLRKADVEGEYRFVGPAYIEDLMDGHAWPENEEDLQDITLV